MSVTTTRLPYDVAYRVALTVQQALAPFCLQVAIAGSVRRQQPTVGDLELVCIPRHVPAGLFSDALEVDPGFGATVRQWPKIKGEPTGRYTQRVLPGGMVLDLCMADAENWGSILLIRTGDAAFSTHVISTLLPRQGYHQQGGYVWREQQKCSVPTEHEMFRLAGLDWIDPSHRVGPSRRGGLSC